MSEAVTQSTPNRIPTPEELGFDPGALREKYAAERAKRLRADANSQYQEITGQFAHYNEDHYVEPGFTRPALHEEIDVVIIGGGFGGMLAAVRLQEVGITNFRIIEKAGDFGGTWYWNRYPGAQCDVEGYLYLPLLEETLHSQGKVFLRAGNLCPRSTNRQAIQALREGLLSDENKRSALGR